MPSHRPLARHVALALAATLATACAHSGATAHHTHLQPPATTDRLPFEELGRLVGDLSIEVMVDSLGHADPASLRLTGSTAAETRSALERWAARARFTPARQDGHAVAAKYTTRLRTVVRSERRG